MPRLSIVVPVYRVEDYIVPCLESLRSLEPADEVEIICVNDGSPDASRDILALYAALDERIRIVDKENGGLSSARNAGIDAATGDYVAFVDSDDFVEPFYARCLLDAFDANEPDVVVFGARIWPESASYPWLELVLSPKTCHYEGFSAGLLYDPGTRPFAWRVAVRRELLEETGLRFDESVEFGEDQIFLLGLYPRARHISVISAKPYVYRAVRTGSLMSGRFWDRTLRAHDHVRIIEHVLRDWAGQGFLGTWGRDLFFWSVDFCVPDILLLANPGRSDVLIYLSCTYGAFYSREELERYCAEPGEVAAFARAALVDRTLTSGVKHKHLMDRHTLSHEGIEPFVRRPIDRIKFSPLVNRGRDLMYRYAPALTERAKWEAIELSNQARDADQLIEALETLNRDLMAAGLDPILEAEEEAVGDAGEGVVYVDEETLLAPVAKAILETAGGDAEWAAPSSES